MRIPEPEVGLARSQGSACDAADTLGQFRHWPIALLIRGSGRAAAYRSSYRTRTLTVAYEPYAMAMTCLRGRAD